MSTKETFKTWTLTQHGYRVDVGPLVIYVNKNYDGYNYQITCLGEGAFSDSPSTTLEIASRRAIEAAKKLLSKAKSELSGITPIQEASAGSGEHGETKESSLPSST